MGTAEAQRAFRVVVLHHPPIARRRGLEDWRCGLRAQARDHLQRLLLRHRVDLVLHGHTHRPFVGRLGAPDGPLVVEAGSATLVPPPGRADRTARYNIYDLDDGGGGARLRLRSAEARVWSPALQSFQSRAVPVG